MADMEPFFFHTEGYGVIYLAFQYGSYDEYSGQTYIATGAFQNMNQLDDGKYIYYLDGRYTDQMNDASIHGKTNISDTYIFTKAEMKKFIKDQHLDISSDGVTLYSSGDFYWFVREGVIDSSYSKRPAKRSFPKSKKNSSASKKKSPNKNSPNKSASKKSASNKRRTRRKT